MAIVCDKCKIIAEDYIFIELPSDRRVAGIKRLHLHQKCYLFLRDKIDDLLNNSQ